MSKSAAALLALLGVGLLVAMVGPLVAGGADVTVGAPFAPPSASNWLGTDVLGRDVWLRMLSGGRKLVVVSLIATVVAISVGTALGFLLVRGGRLAAMVSFALDTVLVAPAVLVMMVVIFGMGASVWTLIVVVTIATAPYSARYSRSVITPILSSAYVTSSRLAGDSSWRIAIEDALPVAVRPLLTDAGLRFVSAMYLVATAGFLGLNPLGDGNDWATQVQQSLSGMALNPWATIAPIVAIAAITVPANLLLDNSSRDLT